MTLNPFHDTDLFLCHQETSERDQHHQMGERYFKQMLLFLSIYSGITF